jgi:membrane associated rhomboid family serine protease
MGRVALEELQNLTADKAELAGLVLAAARVPYYYRRQGRRHGILVREQDAGRARAALAAYYEENPEGNGPFPPSLPCLPPFPGDFSGVWAAALLFLFHAFVGPLDYRDWPLQDRGADARLIVSGEVWRAVTALFLHADTAHLIGNMGGLAVFGSALCQTTGPGVGWALVLACGAAGNMLNAWAYQDHHLSVGASTAVFAALGLLGALRAAAPWARRISPLARWVPLGAGLGLLAFLGTRGETDVLAHFFGWLAGGAVGAPYILLVRKPPGPWIQRGALAATVLTIAGCWALALL